MSQQKICVVLGLSLLMLTGFVSAEETIELDESDFEQAHEQLEVEELKQEVNDRQDDIPSFVANIIGDQRINVYFLETDAVYSADMDGTTIGTLQESEMEDPTLEVEVNESSLEAVFSSEKPLNELKNQLDEGGISYETMTRTNQVRMFITERVVDIFSRFSSF